MEGEHHGRLAIEQTYGYMCFDKVRYGIMATFNAFVFMKRQNGGILYMSRTIPITSTTPTILKLLYFFSHLCALHPEPYPEVNSEGIAIHLKSAPKTPDKAPKIPDPNYRPPPRAGALPPPNFEGGPRRSPRFHGAFFDDGDAASRCREADFSWLQRLARNIDQWPSRLREIMGRMEILCIRFRTRSLCILPPP